MDRGDVVLRLLRDRHHGLELERIADGDSLVLASTASGVAGVVVRGVLRGGVIRGLVHEPFGTSRESPWGVRGLWTFGKVGVLSGSTNKRYPAGLRARAVWMYHETRPGYEGDWLVMVKVAGLVGVSPPETLRRWVLE